MDDPFYHYPDVDVPDTQPALLNQEWLVMEARRVRAQQVEVARIAECQQTQTQHAVGSRADADIPLPFATPPGAAPTF